MHVVFVYYNVEYNMYSWSHFYSNFMRKTPEITRDGFVRLVVRVSRVADPTYMSRTTLQPVVKFDNNLKSSHETTKMIIIILINNFYCLHLYDSASDEMRI